MNPKTILSIAGAAAALGTGGIAATGAVAHSSSTQTPASAQSSRFVRHIEGPIAAIDRAAGTFTVRDREHGNRLSTIHVTRDTRFDGVAGFGALRSGQRVAARAVRANGVLTATKVERGDRGAEPGDDRGAAEVGDDRGHDGPGHDAGDDRGSGEQRGHDG